MKNIDKATEKIDNAFGKHIAGKEGIAGICILTEGVSITANIAGTMKEVYLAIASFLCESPEFIDVFDKGVSDAKLIMTETKLKKRKK